jgi:hypothetical protein
MKANPVDPKLADPLATATAPDRPNYAFGVMLDATDFTDEQTYHRGRLARALQTVHGAGTLAGLAVSHSPAVAPVPADNNPGHAEELQVAPGYAIDGLGRLIEVTRPQCVTIDRWWNDHAQREPAAMRDAFKADRNGLVADLFIRFVACGRGRTPAFAYGPADALDATVYARVRDAFELKLVPRREPNPLPTPKDPWAAIAGASPADRLASAKTAILGAYDQLTKRADRDLVPIAIDPKLDWLLLARVVFPATLPAAPAPPARGNTPPTIDNTIRPFVIGTGALLRLLQP